MSSILTFKISLWKSNKDTYPYLFFEGKTCSTHSKKFSNEWLRQESKLPFKIGFRSLPGWHWSPRQIWWTSRASTSYCIPEWWGLPDEDAPQAPQLWLAARASPACGSHMQPSDCPRPSLFLPWGLNAGVEELTRPGHQWKKYWNGGSSLCHQPVLDQW